MAQGKGEYNATMSSLLATRGGPESRYLSLHHLKKDHLLQGL